MAVFARLYTEMLQLGNSYDATKLRNYRRSDKDTSLNGDFASVLYDVVKFRGYDATDISVAEVNKKLDQLVEARETEGQGRAEQVKILRQLFR